jgi:hypothetical protein
MMVQSSGGLGVRGVRGVRAFFSKSQKSKNRVGWLPKKCVWFLALRPRTPLTPLTAAKVKKKKPLRAS